MRKNDVTPSNVKETWSMGRMTSYNGAWKLNQNMLNVYRRYRYSFFSQYYSACFCIYSITIWQLRQFFFREMLNICHFSDIYRQTDFENYTATDRSKAVVSVLFLLCMALWFILRGASCFKVFPCSLSSCFVIPLSIVITSLGEEGAGLCASRAFVFVLYVLVFVIFLFLMVSGVGCGLWLWHSLNFSINFLYVSTNMYRNAIPVRCVFNTSI